MHIIHIRTYIHTYIDIYTYIYPGRKSQATSTQHTQRPNPEERATIGLPANIVREPANQNALLKTQPPSSMHPCRGRPKSPTRS